MVSSPGLVRLCGALHGVNFRCILALVTELATTTFNVVLLVIVSFNSDLFSRLQVN